ncbi:MAG TPA: hypothetical protein DCL73_16520 [Treponema sp.]|nr:hypothetical protein [Treponema sp.]
MKYALLPAFLFSSVLISVPLAAQTELDAHAQAASYGKEYVPVPENQSVLTPSLLEGIWQGADRYVFFVAPSEEAALAAEIERAQSDAVVNPIDTPDSVVKTAVAAAQPSDLAVVLKTYYGWFYDRAAEPSSYAGDTARFRCTATTEEAEHVTVTYEPLLMRTPLYDAAGNAVPEDSGAWELVIQYGTKQRNVTRIPVAVIGNSLYLNFTIKGQTDDSPVAAESDQLSGYWQGVSRQSGIRVSPFPMNENITSYYVTDDAVYTLRYWVSTMEYTDANASFTDGDRTFHVPKHIVSDGSVFTCVTGRSLQIRNVEKSAAKLTDYTLDSTGTLCAFGKPYLTKVTGKDNAASLMQIVAEANKRRKPDPKPLFSPGDVNWYWDIINLLEKDNAQIQAVRKRQQEFASTNGREGRTDAVQAASYSTYTKLETAADSAAAK